MLYCCRLSVHFTLSLQVLLNPWGDLDETWYKWRCAYCKGIAVRCFLKELGPLDLGFSMQNTLSSQLLLNPWGDFDETWYKERPQCGDVHIARGVLSNVF